jgi:hypothetical protein
MHAVVVVSYNNGLETSECLDSRDLDLWWVVGWLSKRLYATGMTSQRKVGEDDETKTKKRLARVVVY